MIVPEEDYLAHYGILRRSGRYPWGSGGDENQDFLGYVEGLKKQGLSEAEIAKGLSDETHQVSVADLRNAKSIAKNRIKAADIAMAQRLKDKGMSNVAIGERMGKPESTVRTLLAPGQQDKVDVLNTTTSMLKEQVAQKKYVDIGAGVELQPGLGISANKLSTAVAALREEGYEVHTVKIEQLGTGKFTEVKVLAPPGSTQKEVWQNRDQIQQIAGYSEDGGRSFNVIQPPLSISSKRVAIRYAEQGGSEADGVIYVRPGVHDVSLGGSAYAQVRIAVDGTHYLKGMAMYKDGLPAGADLVFNTNKSNTGNKLDSMKELKRDKETGEVDKDLPFGSVISRQITDGNKNLTSVMNIVNDEGDWEKWSRNLSSQMLSKQSPALVKSQLDMTYERRKNELDSIKALTNPEVRRKLLDSYADSADAAAIHLKAAALPRQKTHVILPVASMKPDEVYAPNYPNGTRVALVRFPHGGTFEIPELTVNNKNSEARKLLGTTALNAIGIHHSVAKRLSGADFDGDTVLVIPNNKRQIKSSKPLKDLEDFDPVRAYPEHPGMQVMDARTKGHQMGLVSNLITDMNIKGASNEELARAVRHSMVVIDAEKHRLNYKQSAIDNGIPSLMEKYQGRKTGGAATVVSNSGVNALTRIPERIPRPLKRGGPIDHETGKLVYEPTGATYPKTRFNKRTGETRVETVLRKTALPKLAAVEDAHQFSSGTLVETLYADHSNRMKALANEARREMVNTKGRPYSPSARAAYSKEVASLNAKLTIAQRNAPLERQAQILANAQVRQKTRANPDMDKAELKKLKGQALLNARNRVGAGKTRIVITPSEWDAIQAGAITNSKLKSVLDNANLDQVKELATPKSKVLMTSTKVERAKAMIASGYTQAEVADQLGVSLTTLKIGLSG